MAQKPSLPKGTRDFGPVQMAKRTYILESIKKVFKKYGFLPLETPAMENLSVLTGKYGDEGDQLLFKVLNSGNFLNKTSREDFEAGSKALSTKITEKGLKYDLTVPFARYVVMNQNDIAFPFKRYQIQPVWRADRPQKGRYREFHQCDADIVGTNSLLCEAELLAIVTEVYSVLNFNDYEISLSSRKILEGIAECCNASDQFSAFCVILDKLDKIGLDKVKSELSDLGLSSNDLRMLEEIISISGDNQSKLDSINRFISISEMGKQGVSELSETLKSFKGLGFDDDKVKIDFKLARGLSYYTGVIYEVKPTSIRMGTITAGGRYDNLTGVFCLEDMSGVGISFGIDRIYDTLSELDLFPKAAISSSEILITNFDAEGQNYALGLVSKLRTAGIAAELYPDSSKLKKQMSYADKKGIPFVIMLGSQEIESGNLTLKNMASGEQTSLTLEELIVKFGN